MTHILCILIPSVHFGTDKIYDKIFIKKKITGVKYINTKFIFNFIVFNYNKVAFGIIKKYV